MYGLPYQPIHWPSRTTFFKPEQKESQPQSFPERKTNFSLLMKTLKNLGDLGGRTKCSYVLQTCPDSRLSWPLMRPFFTFLGLLLCLIPIRADEQTVIKDSEAIRYVGRYVEVYGLVVSVTASPFGTIFINFGREYPNQTFAGFIPADSGITADKITKLQGKIIGIVGIIELHKGKPEIKIMSMYQIVDLSSKLAE